MEQSTIEYYHNSGYMPDRYYYQQNRRAAQENYKAQRLKFSKGRAKKRENETFIERFIIELMNKTLETTVKKALNEIFKDFK